MITDTCCDKVYFSSDIVYYQCWRDLKPLLLQLKIPFDFIHHTKDLWVRDFMPIQVSENRFVQFVYHPSYLQGLERYRSNPNLCTQELPYPLLQSNILLDGGNVIKCDDCVLITDKVFSENCQLSPTEIIDELQRILDTEVVIIPNDPLEECGHADGMVRYLGNQRVLLNHYCDFDLPLREKLIKALTPRFEIVELHYGTARYLATSWAYLNYLLIGKDLFVPCLNRRLDEVVYRQLEEALHVAVHPIRCRSTVKIGGGLNCLSWTVKEPIKMN